MFCSNCGKEIESNAKFCGHCGMAIQSGNFCSKCDALNKSDAQFCIKCGTNLVHTQSSQVAQDITTPAPVTQTLPPRPAVEVPQAKPAQVQVPVKQPKDKVPAAAAGNSSKSKIGASVLAVLFGQLGLHRFYAGKNQTAGVLLLLAIAGYITMIFSFVGYIILGVLAVWILIDFIMIQSGKFKDGKGLLIK